MRKSLLISILLILPNSANADTNKVLGKWARGDGVAKVDIYACGNNICAKNFWIKSGVKDEKVGDILIMSIKPIGANNLIGKANDPQRNLTYKIKIYHNNESMITKGCFLGGVICKSVNWKKL